MKTLLIFAVCLLILLPYAASSQTWTQQGPTAFKNVHDLTITSNGSILYGADETQVVVATSGGSSWGSTSGSLGGMRAIACNASYTAIATQPVLASGPSGFYRSTNGGGSWSLIETGYSNKPLALAYFTTTGNTSRVLAGRKGTSTPTVIPAIRYSTDDGASWNTWNQTDLAVIQDLCVYPSSTTGSKADDAFAASSSSTTSSRGIYFTSDGGASWSSASSVASQYPTAIAVRTSNDELYAGTTNGRIYRGVDADGFVPQFNPTWTQLTTPTGLSTGDSIRAIVINQTNNLLYAASDKNLFKSTDWGSTWTAQLSSVPDQVALSLAVNPSNNATVLAGGAAFINYTTNSGTTWNYAAGSTGGLNVSSVNPLGTVPPSTTTSWAVSPAISSSMKFDGTNWTYTRIPSSTTSVFSGNHIIRHPDNHNLFASGAMDDKEALFVSSNDGTSYGQLSMQTATANTYFKGVVIDPKNHQRMYAFGKVKDGTANEAYFFSDNSGGTWSHRDPWGTSWYALDAMACMNDGGSTNSYTLYAGTQTKGLWQGISEGSSWTQVGTATSSIYNREVFALAANKNVQNTLYAGVENGLWKTTNALAAPASVNFSQVRTDTIHAILIDPRYTDASYSSNYVIVAARAAGATTDKIYWTTNGGTNWTDVTAGFPTGSSVSELRSDETSTLVMHLASTNSTYKVLLPAQPGGLNPNGTTVNFCSPPQLCWGTTTGAGWYRVQLSTSPTFSTIFDSGTVAGTCYTIGHALSCGTTYYWHVAGSGMFGDGVYSATANFTATTIAPMLSSPASGTQNLDNCQGVTLSWNAITTCPTGTYYLQTAEDANFTVNVVNYPGITTTSKFVGLACGKTYNWHVRADGCPNSPWSATWTYATIPCTPAAPSTAITPTNGQGSVEYCDQVFFSWSSVPGGDIYSLEVASDANMTNIVWTGSSFTNSLTTNNFSQTKNTSYYWHVDAINNCNNSTSSWSSTWSYTTSNENGLPSFPTLTSPTNGSGNVCQNPVFTWSVGKWATKNRLQVSTSPGFEPQYIVRDVVILYASGSYTYANPALSLGTVYYWQVRGENCYGVSGYSDDWSFTTVTMACQQRTVEMPTASEKVIPSDFSLAQNYPNPFNPTTRFDYAVPQDVHVSLRVFNVLGQQVAELVDEFQTAGYKTIEFDASTLPSGLYFYRLQAGTFTDIKKMMLVK